MREKELCIALVKSITEILLNYAESESEALKIIKIGVQVALNSYKKEEK
jgi:hypothetical protein